MEKIDYGTLALLVKAQPRNGIMPLLEIGILRKTLGDRWKAVKTTRISGAQWYFYQSRFYDMAQPQYLERRLKQLIKLVPFAGYPTKDKILRLKRLYSWQPIIFESIRRR